MNPPKIQITILQYNNSEDTVKCLESVKNLRYPNFEVVVVDNASEEAHFNNLQKVIHPVRGKTPAEGGSSADHAFQAGRTSNGVHRTTSHQSDPLTTIKKEGRIGAGQASSRFYLSQSDNHKIEDPRFAGSESGQVGYPQVKVVRNSKNLGFSGGNNVGIRQALQNGTSWVVLLNNDTWVEKDFLERLSLILSVKNGVVGIPLIEGDPAPILSADPRFAEGFGEASRHSERRRDWGGASRVAYCGKIQWLKPTLEHVRDVLNVRDDGNDGDKQLHQLQQAKQGTVLYPAKRSNNSNIYAIGGAMAINKDVFEKIGLLDEKYFLYFEDADFSIRARKAGFDISIAQNVSVHHRVSSSTKKLGSPLLLRYHYRNALYFNLKNGPWYIKLLVWPWSLIIVIKQLGKLVINRNEDQSKAILVGVMDFYKNKMGQIK